MLFMQDLIFWIGCIGWAWFMWGKAPDMFTYTIVATLGYYLFYGIMAKISIIVYSWITKNTRK